MEPITLLAVAGLVALALKKQAPATAPAPLGTPQQPVVGPGPEAIIGPGTELLGKVGKETGIDAKDVIKTAGAVAAAAAAALAADQAAQAIDKFFGGDGKGATGVILRAGMDTVVGGTVLMVLLVKLGIVTAVTFSTIFSATGIGAIIVAVTWLCASGIADLERLRFGQQGAEVEMINERNKMADALRKTMRARMDDLCNKAGYPHLSNDVIDRAVLPMAAGYIWRWNQLRYETWMKRPWGLGQGREYHAKFGSERGYFWGATDKNGNLVQLDAVGHQEVMQKPQAVTPAYQAWVASLPADQKVATTRTTVVAKQVQVKTVDKAKSEALKKKLGEMEDKHYITTTKTVYENVTSTMWRAKNWDGFFQAGEVLANIGAYVKWMKEEWGIGQSAEGHAKWGLSEGRFVGEIDNSGALNWNTGLPPHRYVDKNGKEAVEPAPTHFYWKDIAP